MKSCSKCKKSLPFSEFHKCSTRRDGLQSKCKPCAKLVSDAWRKNNPEKARDLQKKWLLKNPEKAYEKSKRWHAKNPEYQARYKREKRQNDPVFAMADRLRCRIRNTFNSAEKSKPASTIRLVGCNWVELKAHIESKFKDGMSWINRSEWHIDHIIPLCSAKNEHELSVLCHYTNLQPLWAYDNRSKGGKIL